MPTLRRFCNFFRLPETKLKTRGQEIATPDFRQARNDTTVSDKSLTVVCRLAHPTVLHT
ncbi:MAG: hypothetical protein IKZ88_03425 [Neisseriaceae bacterium]|nr:hypothetical protein [Neisseriaceae bacterium]